MTSPTTLPERYLELIKRSLLNELYPELEAILHYFILCRRDGRDIDPDAVRDIARARPDILDAIRTARREGSAIVWPDAAGGPPFDPRNLAEHVHTMTGRQRLDHLHACLDAIIREGVPGDLIEAGAWRGGATIFMRAHLAAHGVTDRVVWVADSFEGVPPPSCIEDEGVDLSAAREPILAIDQARVAELFERYGVLDDQVRFLPGWFRDTLAAAPIEQLALLRLDGDLYESTMDALLALYDRLAPGGFVVVDGDGPVSRAVEAFRAERAITAPLETFDGGGVAWRKSAGGDDATRPPPVRTARATTLFVPPGHYYSPIVDPAALRARADQVFDRTAPMPEIDLRLDAQVALLRRLAAHYADLPFGERPTDALRFGYDNPNFSYADAVLRACMMRELKPRRIVEVGCGHSSCIVLDVNERFFGGRIACTFVEPNAELLRSLTKPGDRYTLIDKPVQDVDLALFRGLEAGDFLLIDSTHVSKAGSDVNHHFSKILPALATGVIVFFHDVFHPFEYPQSWFFEENRSWNEIYVLRAFLAYNRAYEIVLFTDAIEHHHPGLVAALMPLAAKNLGGSFWMRRTESTADQR